MQNLPLLDAIKVPHEELSYEDAFNQFEEIVSILETDEHDLDTALTLFERGQVLARYCARMLDQAELKIQQLNSDELVDFDS